jgi:hypothetical protein
MRILLIQSSVYIPSHGGANKSNRLLLEALAKRGHECRAVAACCGVHACTSQESFRKELHKRGIAVIAATPNLVTFEMNDIRVTASTDLRTQAACIAPEVDAFDPEFILVASEDPGQVLLRTTLRIRSGQVVYVGRTTLLLPCGPESPLQNSRSLDLLRHLAGIVVVSKYLREYLRKWAGIESLVLPLSLNGPGPFPELGGYDRGHVTIVNPCAYKGISIFMALARQFPELSFAAVPSWGTTKSDSQMLANLSNVYMLEPSDDVDQIFSETRVLLVPSLWSEAKANVITEAMLRGIPVLASDAGGNSEALLGLDYLLPVNQISRYGSEFDTRLLPMAVVPEQNIGPWCDALRSVLSTPREYEKLSRAVRCAALAANEMNTVLPLEQYLLELHSRRNAASSTTSLQKL